jgi:hypothetical protein
MKWVLSQRPPGNGASCVASLLGSAIIAACTWSFALAEPAKQGAPSCIQGTDRIKPVDLRLLSDHFQKTNMKKGEFETTAEQSKRIAPAVDEMNKIIQQYGRSELLFSLPISAEDVKYDADSSLLTISNFMSVLPRDLTTDALIFSYASAETGTFIGTNAFGARKEITRYNVHELLVTAPKRTLEQTVGRKAIELKLPRDEAKRMRDDLRFLILAKMKSPYFSTSNRKIEATFDRPREYNSTIDLLHADILCVALFDISTARLFAS